MINYLKLYIHNDIVYHVLLNTKYRYRFYFKYLAIRIIKYIFNTSSRYISDWLAENYYSINIM